MRKLASIQALRGIAALAVVITHCWIMAYWLGQYAGKPFPHDFPINGAAGVDLFFVISGFIMVHASAPLYGTAGARRVFARRRVVRVMPVYWIATTVTAIWLFAMGPPPDRMLAFTSFFLFPYSPGGGLAHVVPIVDPAWTLSFEMVFYAIFCLCLAGSARQTVLRASALLAALVLAGLALPGSPPAWLFTWTRPILLEFIAGMGIALAWRAGIRVPGCAAAIGLLAGCAILFLWTPQVGHWQGWTRVLTELPPAALIVAGAMLGRTPLPSLTPLTRLGDASYSIYIWHIPLLMVMRRPWLHVLPFNGLAFALVGLAGSLAAGWISYRWIEVPIGRRFRNRRGESGSGGGT